MRIAISLLWLRHKASGGVESYSRNILDGLKNHDDNNHYILICSADNADSFTHYSKDPRFEVYRCEIGTGDTKRMLYFENFELDKLITEFAADLCFVPTYRMPLLYSRNKYVVVIHDLVAYWFPQNFSCIRRKWLQWGWKRSVVKAKKVIAISEFVREDIVKRYGRKYFEKIDVIYNPILPSKVFEDFASISHDYMIEKYQYFYTVSSTMKHKNLLTLIKVMGAFVKAYGKNKTPKLLISGVGLNGPEAKTHFTTNEVLSLIKEESLDDVCLLTGFVSNERRNSLMKNAKLFLFPSLFEGFGMPPIEALEMGTPVVCSKCTAIPEVTQGKCTYVGDPYNVEEWMRAIENTDHRRMEYIFEDYEIGKVTQKYLDSFDAV